MSAFMIWVTDKNPSLLVILSLCEVFSQSMHIYISWMYMPYTVCDLRSYFLWVCWLCIDSVQTVCYSHMVKGPKRFILYFSPMYFHLANCTCKGCNQSPIHIKHVTTLARPITFLYTHIDVFTHLLFVCNIFLHEKMSLKKGKGFNYRLLINKIKHIQHRKEMQKFNMQVSKKLDVLSCKTNRKKRGRREGLWKTTGQCFINPEEGPCCI